MTGYIDGSDVAIIGMSARFPGANNVEEFWRNLRDGVESIRFFTDEELKSLGVNEAVIRSLNYVKAAAIIDEAECSDASFFGMTHREAEITDPQHRALLESAWAALEHAGYDPESYKGSIGVFAGATINTYLLINMLSNPQALDSLEDVQINIGNGADFLTTRISYKLNLRGPSHVVQSACSTSLVAVHVACQSLLNGECDMALAGGVSINVKHRAGYRYIAGGMTSPDGHCRAFDSEAQGTIFGNGVGVVVLKPLMQAVADQDCIHAVIKGSAINNDGSFKVGYTAPSVDGQASVIAEAMANAGVEPDSISYIEAHGTATPLGDPVEMQALTKAFRASTNRKRFCAIGSVKTNIGHLDAAAGIAGLIKTVLSLKRKQLPPSLHFKQPNERIDFDNSPFYVNDRLSNWEPGHTRRAGVSAFGVGGTNAHIIIEEAPPVSASGESRRHQLIMLSARTPTALSKAAANLKEHFKLQPDLNLADAAYTLQVGRRSFKQRRFFVSSDVSSASNALESSAADANSNTSQQASDPPIVFMFPGQGAQYLNMASDLYEQEKVFRNHVARCSALLRSQLGFDLLEVLYPAPGRGEAAQQQLNQTSTTQPAVFVVEYALAQLWLSWGVRPKAMIGHSIGEYVAACLAGVLSLDDALMLVAMRGRLMQSTPAGAMTAVPLPAGELRSLLPGPLSIAAVNGPSQCIVSGPIESVSRFEEHLSAKAISSRRLNSSHAFHSRMMDSVLDSFACQVKKIKLNAPAIPYLSNVTGGWITASETCDPIYWVRQLSETVRFSDCLEILLKGSNNIFLEIGPGQALSRLVKQQSGGEHNRVVLASLQGQSKAQPDDAFLLRALGQLWQAGTEIDWQGFYGDERRQRIELPTYPFERQRYWIEPVRKQIDESASCATDAKSAWSQTDEACFTLHPRPQLQSAYVAPVGELETRLARIWQKAIGVEQIGALDNFFELGGDSLLAMQVVSQINQELKTEISAVSLYEGITIKSLAQLMNSRLAHGEADQGPDNTAKANRRKQYQESQRARKRQAAADYDQ